MSYSMFRPIIEVKHNFCVTILFVCDLLKILAKLVFDQNFTYLLDPDVLKAIARATRSCTKEAYS